MPERHDHGQNLIGTVRIELVAKSFILRAFAGIANDKQLIEPFSSLLYVGLPT
jgi:hypothetical protein